MANERINMTKIRQILRLKNENISKRDISNMLGIHRETVTNYILLFEAVGLSYEEIMQKTDEELDALFSVKESPPVDRYEKLISMMPYFEKELSRTGVTKMRLWEEYKREYPGGYNYSQFCYHIQNWQKKNGAVMHFEHKAGDKMFVDFTGKHLYITDRISGELTELEVFVAILGSSQMTYVEAVQSQQKDDYITAVENSLIYFNGIPAAIVPDNLKSAVTKSCPYEPDLNEDFQNFAIHYNTVILPTRSRKPRDKALVEGAVKIVYNRIYAALRNRTFFSRDDLNEAIREELDKHNKKNFQGRDYSRYDQFKSIEQQELRPLSKERYELKDYAILTVYKNCHIWLHCDKHYYSVPFKYIGKKVKVIYSKRNVEIYHNYSRIAVHRRDYSKYKYSTIKDHIPSAHQFVSDWNPDKFINWASGIGEDTEKYIRKILDNKQHPEQAYKSCIGILQFAKKYGKARLNKACRRGIYYHSYNYKVIRNILQNNYDKTEIEVENQYRLPIHKNVRGSSYYN
jgi:transposase